MLERREELRTLLKSSQGTSAFYTLGAPAALMASLPSGLPRVRAARDELESLVSECCPLPSIDFAACGYPAVWHLNDGAHRYRPDVVYVGSVYHAADISPWSMPFPEKSFQTSMVLLKPALTWSIGCCLSVTRYYIVRVIISMVLAGDLFYRGCSRGSFQASSASTLL